MQFVKPVTLTGRNWVAFEPLQREHADQQLVAAKDSDLWRHWSTSGGDPDAVFSGINAAHKLREGLGTLPFAQLTLLSRALEILGCLANEFRTHWFNFDNRATTARLGVQQDGKLRNHQLAPNGTPRDTMVCSILVSKWPTVKAHLRFQLNKPRG